MDWSEYTLEALRNLEEVIEGTRPMITRKYYESLLEEIKRRETEGERQEQSEETNDDERTEGLST